MSDNFDPEQNWYDASIGANLLGIPQQKAQAEASKIQAEAAGRALDEQRRQFDIIQENLRPYREGGLQALERQQALLSPEAAQVMRDSGAFQRAVEAGMGAVEGSGIPLGRQRLQALRKRAEGMAMQDYGNQFNRLGALSGTGQAATTQANQFLMQQGAREQQFAQDRANALASGVIGQANTQNQALSNLANVGGTLAGYYANKPQGQTQYQSTTPANFTNNPFGGAANLTPDYGV